MEIQPVVKNETVRALEETAVDDNVKPVIREDPAQMKLEL
jgi:hypothetical protein